MPQQVRPSVSFRRPSVEPNAERPSEDGVVTAAASGGAQLPVISLHEVPDVGDGNDKPKESTSATDAAPAATPAMQAKVATEALGAAPQKKNLWKQTRTKVMLTAALSHTTTRSGDNILIENELNNMPFFSNCSSQLVSVLALKALVQSFTADDIIVKQSASGTSMILILRGSVDMLIGGEKVQTLSGGQYFGETNILGLEQQWSVTLCARTKCEACEILREDFQTALNICKDDARTFEAIVAMNRSCMMDGTLVKTCKILHGLSQTTLHSIDLNVVRRIYFPGEKILKEGTPGDEVYILVQGRANVEIAGRVVRSEGCGSLPAGKGPDEDKAAPRRQSVRRGSMWKESSDPVCFGELGFFGMQPYRTATVVAQAVCQVRVLFRSVFLQKLQDHGESLHLQEMSQFLAQRYNKQIKAPTVALKEVKLFQEAGCSNEFLAFVAKHLEDRVYLAGQKILDENCPEDKCMYLLGRGEANVMKNGFTVRVAGETEVFGEIALLGLSAHEHWTLVAVETCYTQVLHQNVIIRGLELFPEERQKVLMMAFKQADDGLDDDEPQELVPSPRDKSVAGRRRSSAISMHQAGMSQSRGFQDTGRLDERRQTVSHTRMWKSKTHDAVMRAMKKSQLFSGVSHAFLDQLSGVSIDRIYMPGDLIMEEGKRGDSMFIMVSGTAGVFVRDPDSVGDAAQVELKSRAAPVISSSLDKTSRIGMLTSGSISGELAMLGVSLHRSASIQAETLCSMWEITQDNALSILGNFPDAQNHFANIVLDRLERTAPARVLQLPLFQSFDRKFRMLVGLYCEKRAYFPSQFIVREGRTGDGMYVVNMGRATLDKQGVTIKTYSPGDTFGATIMLGLHKRVIGSLIALQTCHILVLSHTSFGLALEKYPCHSSYVELKQLELVEYDEFKKALQRITARKLIWKRYQKLSNMDTVNQAFVDEPGDSNVSKHEMLSTVLQTWKKFAVACVLARTKLAQRRQKEAQWIQKARQAKERRTQQETEQKKSRNADARYPNEIDMTFHPEFDASQRSPSPAGSGSEGLRSPSPDAVSPSEDYPRKRPFQVDPNANLPRIVDYASPRQAPRIARDRDYEQELAYGNGQTSRRRGRSSPRKAQTPRLPAIYSQRAAGGYHNDPSHPSQESPSGIGQAYPPPNSFANMDDSRGDAYALQSSHNDMSNYGAKLDRGLPFTWDSNALYLPLPANSKMFDVDRGGCTRILWQGARV